MRSNDGGVEEFVSEPISPVDAGFDTAGMSRGEPGLPCSFAWRDDQYDIVEVLEQWKESAPEGHRAGAEVYLRRHCWTLRMSDNAIWRIYFARQSPSRGSQAPRWFLLTRQAVEPTNRPATPPRPNPRPRSTARD